NQLFVDPLLQAIVLTAIVIGFGMTAFLLVLVYRTYKVTKEDEIEGLRGEDDAK
ncbi:antiporter, partial [Escherichia coli]|nr:antiporter [Escherichia coli]